MGREEGVVSIPEEKMISSIPVTNIKGCPLNKHEETTIEYTLLIILLVKYCKHNLSSVTKYNSSEVDSVARYCMGAATVLRVLCLLGV